MIKQKSDKGQTVLDPYAVTDAGDVNNYKNWGLETRKVTCQ